MAVFVNAPRSPRHRDGQETGLLISPPTLNDARYLAFHDAHAHRLKENGGRLLAKVVTGLFVDESGDTGHRQMPRKSRSRSPGKKRRRRSRSSSRSPKRSPRNLSPRRAGSPAARKDRGRSPIARRSKRRDRSPSPSRSRSRDRDRNDR